MTGCVTNVRLTPIPLSLEERDRRYSAVRSHMATRGLDYILIPHSTGDWDNYQPDLRYLTCVGGGGMAAALVFPSVGDPVVAIRESRRIEWWQLSQNWVRDVRSPPQFIWSKFFIDVLRERDTSQTARIGIVGLNHALRDPEGIISHGEFTAIRNAFPNASFECATDILYDVKKRKSPEEVRLIESAQLCADSIDGAFRATVRPGVTEHELYGEMFSAHIKSGGEVPSMILFSSDKRFWQTQLLPTFRTLERDDVLMVEAEPKYYGYMAQAVTSASLRPLSALEQKLFDVSAECFDLLLSEMKPGRSYRSLIETWNAFAKRKGAVAGRTMGHGLGLGQDGPLTTPSGDAGGSYVEDGDVLVLKPWICDHDDTVAVRIGGTVVVEEKSARRIGQCDLAPCIVH